MINRILFSSFIQIKFATSFETQVKIITCKKKEKYKEKNKPSKISAQHLYLQNLPRAAQL